MRLSKIIGSSGDLILKREIHRMDDNKNQNNGLSVVYFRGCGENVPVDVNLAAKITIKAKNANDRLQMLSTREITKYM